MFSKACTQRIGRRQILSWISVAIVVCTAVQIWLSYVGVYQGIADDLPLHPTPTNTSIILKATENIRGTKKNESLVFKNISLPLCLVHVGKAAGSTVSCGLGFTYADCEGMPREAIPDTYFFHMKRNKCIKRPIKTYLVTLRNPLDRLRSWFNFEKDIVPERPNKDVQESIRRRRGLLFVDCYQNFSSFVRQGLRSLDHSIINASDVLEMSCSERAWAAAMGVRDFSYHEWYNYEHYWEGIHKGGTVHDNITSSIKVLRLEHLPQDWRTVSTEPLFRGVNRGSRPHVVATEGPSMALDEYEKQNLCAALCQEIQFYKRFLQQAENLKRDDIEVSLKELYRDCPGEANDTSSCSNLPVFPKISIGKRMFKQETKKRLFLAAHTQP